MPVYEYTALDSKGKKRSGIVDAESPFAARARLRDTGTFPVSLKEAPHAVEGKSGKGFSVDEYFSRVRPSQVAVVTRQMSTLVGAGLPIVTALSILIPQMPNPRLKGVLAHVKDSIVEGQSFAQGLAAHPRVFSPLYVNMVRAGEASGAMEVVLEGLADLSEKTEANKSKVRQAMAYPMVMTVIGTLVLFILMVKIVPTITNLFEGVHQQLPAPTRLLLAISGVLKGYWWLLAIGVVLVVLGVQRFKRTPRGKLLWDRMILALPLFGPLALNMATGRFSRTLGALLKNGVPLLTALDITKNVLDNVVVRKVVEEASGEIGEGKSLAGALAPRNLFPPIAVQMIDVGEQSGQLEAMLLKVAELYEAEAEGTIQTMTTLLEPLLIVVMAVMVGFIVISILMPLFEMSQLVR
ncbi:MAG: type II secretion system inner membrane protein GspF [Pseudomonadota bacterium]